ncbi:MAG: methylmalonyl-CoA mutase family protein, partial [Silvanigrellales bacterium]|nr:methylmalonyl-CoA mutase family protein [Silvanigrellales bacterium]
MQTTETSFSYQPRTKVRFVTATALFDGHDASINIMRRLLQQGGAEVIHLGHNRSVQEIARAAIEEDAQGIALSSYQGGHMEFFGYLRDVLDAAGRKDMKIFGGGGGVILPKEIAALHAKGVTRIYTPDDGRKLGLLGMISDMLERADTPIAVWHKELGSRPLAAAESLRLARALSVLEVKGTLPPAIAAQVKAGARPASLESEGFQLKAKAPLVLGVTGTGGAGKSSLTDEIIRRFMLEFPEKRLCIFSVDPSKKKTGGALLGDRIRMNAINHPNVFMRSFATRGSKSELAGVTGEAIALARAVGFDLVIVETSGIGQGDTGILGVSDVAMYVMTSEYGASTQLEKIDMLDFADLIAINKFDRRGSEDAYRDVKAQLRRSRFGGMPPEDDAYPLFGTIASKFNDDGVNGLYRALLGVLNARSGEATWLPKLALKTVSRSSYVSPIIPQNRTNYLSEIAGTVREYHAATEVHVSAAQDAQALERAAALMAHTAALPEGGLVAPLEEKARERTAALPLDIRKSLEEWTELRANYEGDAFRYQVRGKTLEVPTTTTSLSGLKVPRVSLPRTLARGDLVRYFRKENLPGSFPFTAGVFPFKRTDED